MRIDFSMHVWTVVVPRRLRRRLFDRPTAKWLVPAWRCLALPVAVSRNRFFVPLWVFCFGMVFLYVYGRRKIGKRAILGSALRAEKGELRISRELTGKGVFGGLKCWSARRVRDDECTWQPAKTARPHGLTWFAPGHLHPI